MISAESFITAATARGIGLWTGVPCSYLTPFINGVISSSALRYIGAANEGDAVAIAAGAELGGVPSVAMFQNSGLGNAVNPLTSLTWTFRLPVLVIVTWRGEPGGAADEPQHELMGRVTPQFLDTMDIPWAPFPAEEAAIAPALDRAFAHFRAEQRPFALVMSKGTVAETALTTTPPPPLVPVPPSALRTVPRASRRDMLFALQSALRPDDVVIATTGYMGRELAALEDRACQLYMVGSMGCASSFGLGLALAQPRRRVIVIDGDGAALMRLGALATVGTERPANLVHLLLDNGLHESTGGQATVSRNVDFAAVAAACGYPRVEALSRPEALARALADATPGLRFIHVPIVPGVPARLPRPTVTPADVAARLRRHLGTWAAGAGR